MKTRHTCQFVNAALKLKYSCSGVTTWHCYTPHKQHKERGGEYVEAAALPRGNLLTTAMLVSTDSASHARVTGGICVTHASIPTGIFFCAISSRYSGTVGGMLWVRERVGAELA